MLVDVAEGDHHPRHHRAGCAADEPAPFAHRPVALGDAGVTHRGDLGVELLPTHDPRLERDRPPTPATGVRGGRAGADRTCGGARPAAHEPRAAVGVLCAGGVVPRRLVRVRRPGRVHRRRHRLRDPRVAGARVALAAVVPRLAARRSGGRRVRPQAPARRGQPAPGVCRLRPAAARRRPHLGRLRVPGSDRRARCVRQAGDRRRRAQPRPLPRGAAQGQRPVRIDVGRHAGGRRRPRRCVQPGVRPPGGDHRRRHHVHRGGRLLPARAPPDAARAHRHRPPRPPASVPSPTCTRRSSSPVATR